MKLANRIALVTGSSSGIGRGVAVAFAREGADVVVNYPTGDQAANAQAACSEIAKLGRKAIAVQADVSQFGDAQRLIKTALDHFGRLDILVNNAGTTRDALLARMSEEDWDLVIAVNLKSAFNCCKAAQRSMLKERYGRIVNITSVAGLAGNAGQANYASAKAGLIGLTKSLAKELGSRNITVNAVAPGYIPTDLSSTIPPELLAKGMERTPLGHPGKPEDIAYAVAFLVSEEASYITGQTLSVDGGLAL